MSSAFTSFLSNGFSFSFKKMKKQYMRTMLFKRLDTVEPEFRKAISLLGKNCYAFYELNEDCYELTVFDTHAMWKFIQYQGLKPKYQHIALKNTNFDEKMVLLENTDYKKFTILKGGIMYFLKNTHFRDHQQIEKSCFEEFVKEKIFNSPIKMEL